MKRSVESQLNSYGQVVEDAVSTHVAENGQHQRSAMSADVPDHGAVGRSVSRKTRLLAPLVAGAIALVAVFIVAPSSQAWAGWTPATQSSDPADVVALDAVCRATTAVSDGLPALVFDIRGEGGTAIYGDERSWATCQADRSNTESFEIVSVQSQGAPDLAVAQASASSSQPVVTISLSWQEDDDAASLVWGVTDGSAAAIEVVTSGGPVEAAVVEGVWVAWWPDDDAATAVVLATNDKGEPIVDDLASSLATPLPDAAAIVSAVESDGTELERRVLADGVVTWAEFQSGLEAWQACVAEAGYELTVEIDQDARDYVAISPTVGVASDYGEPDDAAGEALLEPIMASIDACYYSQLSRIAQVHVQQ